MQAYLREKIQSKAFLIGKLEQIAEISFLGALFVLPFSKAALEFLLSAAGVSWFFSKIASGSTLSHKQFLFLVMGLFVVSSSVSAFSSGFPLIAVRGIVKVIKYSLVLLITADLSRNPDKLKRICIVGLFCFMLVVADATVQRIAGRDLLSGIPVQYADQQIRLTAPFRAYGLLGAFLIGTLPVLASFGLIKGKIHIGKRILLLILFGMGIYILYKTHSRGAWLAAFGSWVLFFLMTRNKYLIFAFAIFLLIAFFALPRNALIHLDTEQKEQSLVERYYLWDRAIHVIKARPWFGCGINTYTRNYLGFDQTKNWRVPGYYVHNGYLQIGAETGLVSLFLFVFLLGIGLRSGYTAFRRSTDAKKPFIAGLITGFVALLLQASVDTTLHNTQSAVLIWFFLGLLIASNDRVKTES